MKSPVQERSPLSTITEPTAADVRAKHKEFLFPSVANYYKESVVLECGKGTHVKDVDGKTYLDFFGGILTVSVGHANDKVNAAIKAQIDRLGHVSTLYPTLPIVELAETLARITPGRLQKSFFTARAPRPTRPPSCSRRSTPGGSRSSRSATATRAARCSRSRSRRTRRGARCRRRSPRSSTRRRPTATAARSSSTYPSCGVACAKDIEELIQTTTTGQIAGFLAEPIQGVGGFVTPPKEYFEIAVDIVRKYGGVFICDEVQTGFGRTGGHWYGIAHWNVEPDIMTMAKGIANGMPLGVTIATPEIADSLQGAHDLDVRRQPDLLGRRERDDRRHGGDRRPEARRRDGRAPARRPRRPQEEVPEDDRRRARHGPDAGPRARGRRDAFRTARPRPRRPSGSSRRRRSAAS